MTDKRKLKHSSKYGAAKPTYKGRRFASGIEMLRFRFLEKALAAGQITELTSQVTYVLVPYQRSAVRNEFGIRYVADFVYRKKDGTVVVEDVKGCKTPTYIIKRKLMLYVHGISIREVTSAAEKI